jgi:TrmH family RNA methyltransferase
LKKITSLQHPLVKHWVHLREDRDYRYQTKRVMISGLKLVSELAQLLPFRTLIVEEGHAPLSCSADQVITVPSQVLKKLTGLKNPEPIAAEIDMPRSANLTSVDFLLILDRISDPGNLGTLLRTALALGWQGVFLTAGSADPCNEKAIRAAKGATFKLPWTIGSLSELTGLLQAKPFTLLAADSQGKDVAKCHLKASPLALILGNEANGIDAELIKKAQIVCIPMQSSMESLNVASAGAILMYQLKEAHVQR